MLSHVVGLKILDGETFEDAVDRSIKEEAAELAMM